VRHRGEVGELGLRGPADPDAEEALVEVELDKVVRPLDILGGDGGAGGDVPDMPAVFLEEVGVALGELEDPGGRRALKVDALRSGGQLERVACGLVVEAVDGGEAEEPRRMTWRRRSALAAAAGRRR
jgi:hypothetical protein